MDVALACRTVWKWGPTHQNRTFKIREIGEEWQFQWDILVKHGKFRGEHGKFHNQMGMDQYLLIPFLGGMNIHLPAILMFTRGTRF